MRFSRLQIIKQTLYSDTEITLRAVITTSAACDSTQHLHIAVRAKKWEQGKVFSQEEMRGGITSKGVCCYSGIRRGAGLSPSCLILAWAWLLCGSPTWYLLSEGLVQEDLTTRATCGCQRGSQARDLDTCPLQSMSMDQSGLHLLLPAAAAVLISPSSLAEEQSPLQNMAQLLWLDFAC